MKNRANTERKLISAVDSIVNTKGFKGLGVNKVAKEAGVSKILIYRYFGTFERLLKSCVHEKDFWVHHPAHVSVTSCNSSSLKELLQKLLKEQFDSFYRHCEMEAFLLNSLIGKHEMVTNLSNNAGYDDEPLFTAKKSTGILSADSVTYFKIISKLLVVGTNQLLLQFLVNERSLNYLGRSQQQRQLQDSIAQILSMASLI